MEEVLTRRKGFVFNRKLTDEETENIIRNYDYDPHWDECDDDDTEPVHDKFGNLTESTVRALYESRHGIGEETTLDELFSWIDSLE